MVESRGNPRHALGLVREWVCVFVPFAQVIGQPREDLCCQISNLCLCERFCKLFHIHSAHPLQDFAALQPGSNQTEGQQVKCPLSRFSQHHFCIWNTFLLELVDCPIQWAQKLALFSLLPLQWWDARSLCGGTGSRPSFWPLHGFSAYFPPS